MILTFEFRLLPSKRQYQALEYLLESQRVLYNAALEERIGAYRHGVTRTYFDQTKALTELRHSDPEAGSCPLAIQRATLKRLDEAYKAFLRRIAKRNEKAGFPRFRGKGWWDSFGFREFVGIALHGRKLRFKEMPGGLRVHLHRPLPTKSRIRSCTFRRDAKGWKVGFAVEVESPTPREGARRVGLDLGISTFAALSDGRIVPSLRAARRQERRLRVAQRALARKQRTSRGRQQARRTLARCHGEISRRRLNHLHQSSARLVREYDVIAIEALGLKALARSALARDVQDVSWGKFVSLLRYKAERAGVQLIEVDPRHTSQNCSSCGLAVPKKLSERWHHCPHCGLSIDRDVNAARNILERAGVGPGLRNVAECGMRAGKKPGGSATGALATGSASGHSQAEFKSDSQT